jgi:hypothetical protein
MKIFCNILKIYMLHIELILVRDVILIVLELVHLCFDKSKSSFTFLA